MSSITFLAFVAYLPRTIFYADATIEDLLWANTNGMNLGSTSALFFDPQRLSLTHSAEAIASLFTDCARNISCLENSNAPHVIFIISKLLLFGTMGIPIIVSAVYMLRIIKHRVVHFSARKTVASIIGYFHVLRSDKQTILFYFILADAMINLVPRISFIYRLYYSLPIVLLMYAETKEHSHARFYCYLSMIALAIKGFWIYYSIKPMGMTIFDARAMNLFLLLHFYFLLRAGLAGIEDRLSVVVSSGRSGTP